MSLTPEAKDAFLALMNEPTLKSNDTKTKNERRTEFERRLLYKTPTSEIAAKIEEAQRVVWIPCAYVLFLRHGLCKNCKAEHDCLDIPRLFLQQRKPRKDESNPYLYTPVQTIEFHQLPRRKIISIASTPFCPACFEQDSTCTSLLSPQASTESPQEDLEKFLPPLSLMDLHAVASSFREKERSPAFTNEVEFAGYPSEKEFGLGSESGETAQPAIAHA